MDRPKLTEELKIRVPEQMDAALKRVAFKRSSSPSQVGREAIMEYLISRGEIIPEKPKPMSAA